MTPTPRTVQHTYYLLTLFSTLAASFIWGINTLFLLDAGLSNGQAFATNAFFTLGQVIFEVPTGLIADTRGRKISYAIGAITLLLTTLAYYWLWQTHGPFWAWAVISALLGLGFTFLSGATEAWLVDALNATGFQGPLEKVFARGQAIGGVAMLVGSVSGGVIAQSTSLGVPYLVRAAMLTITLVICFLMMRDLGFSPQKGKNPIKHIQSVLGSAYQHGWRKSSIRFVMLSSPFTLGVSFYVFYAMQPYLLQLYGDPHAYGIAGLAAAIIAGAQIIGGFLVNYVERVFQSRLTIIIATTSLGIASIAMLGLFPNFWLVLILLVIWGLLFSIATPIRQAYLNGLIRSEERATLLSFDNLIGSSGGVVTQPLLGRAADAFGYAPSYLISSVIQLGALPFLILARKQKASSDKIKH
jgi:MFS family permease